MMAGLIRRLWTDDSASSFVAQGFYGVELGGFDGRPDAENQSYADGDGDAHDYSPQRDGGLHGGHVRNQHGEGAEEKDAEDASRAGERHGLEEELPGDVAAARADGFADADFAGALGDA